MWTGEAEERCASIPRLQAMEPRSAEDWRSWNRARIFWEEIGIPGCMSRLEQQPSDGEAPRMSKQKENHGDITAQGKSKIGWCHLKAKHGVLQQGPLATFGSTLVAEGARSA